MDLKSKHEYKDELRDDINKLKEDKKKLKRDRQNELKVIKDMINYDKHKDKNIESENNENELLEFLSKTNFEEFYDFLQNNLDARNI